MWNNTRHATHICCWRMVEEPRLCGKPRGSLSFVVGTSDGRQENRGLVPGAEIPVFASATRSVLRPTRPLFFFLSVRAFFPGFTRCLHAPKDSSLTNGWSYVSTPLYVINDAAIKLAQMNVLYISRIHTLLLRIWWSRIHISVRKPAVLMFVVYLSPIK